MSTTGSYSQDFNSLITSGNTTWTNNSTLANWYAQRSGTGSTIVAGDGSSNTGALYSFGTGTNSDRALGSIGSGTPKNFAWGLLLQNTSSQTITNITVSYTMEQWRDANSTSQTLSFYYKTSASAFSDLEPNSNGTWTAVSGLNASSPKNTGGGVALNGNLAANQVSKSNIALTGLSLAQGSYIMIKWDDPDHAGSDHGLSIDDLTINWVAGLQNQTITWSQSISPKTFGDADFSLNATASSGLTVTYGSSDPTVATVSGNTVHIVGAGSADITASQAGNGSYNPATDVVKNLAINKADQTISFGALPSKQVGDPDFALSATATSGLTVAFSSSNPSVATVSGNTVTIVGAGSTTITASQAGDANYNAATGQDQELIVTNPNLQDQTISFGALSPVTYGGANFNLTATASSGLTVAYSSSNTDVATVSGNTVTIVGVGTTSITATQGGNGTYNPADPVSQDLVVNTKELTVSGALVDTKTYNGNTDANISGSTLVGIVGGDDVSISGTSGTFADANAGTGIAVTASLTLAGADMGNYFLTQPGGLTGNINKADQTITFNGPLPDQMVGEPAFNISATASSGLAVTFSSTVPSVATVTNAGLVHIVAIGSTFFVASQAGDNNYNAASDVQQQQNITPLAPISIWSNPITGNGLGLTNPYTGGQSVDPGITVSGIGHSAAVTGVSTNDRYNANTWDVASFDNTKYFSFTLTPNNGNAINFSSFAYTSQRSPSGPVSFAIRSSADNYAADLVNPGATGTTLSLSGAQFQGVASAITFRVYAWGASSEGGTFSINDFTFSGNVISAPPQVTVTVTNRSACGSDDGSISTSVTGTGPFTYSWTGLSGSGAGVPYTAGNVSGISNLNYGFYNVTVTDANQTSVTVSNIHVKKGYLPVITHNGEMSSSCGNTGTLIIYAAAGISPYTYSVDGINYQGSNTFTGLAAGPMTIYAKDASGCIGTKNYTILAAAPVTVSSYVYASSSCADDGKINAYRSGGIPPFTYSIDGVNYQAGNQFTGLTGNASYTIYAKDSKGCVGSTLVNVPQGAGLSVVTHKSNSSACSNDGTIQVNASGGTYPYQYSLDNINFQGGASFTDLPSGNYVVYVKDFKGCTGTSNVTINIDYINLTTQVTPASSCEATDGTIFIRRTGGGQGPFTYSIDGNNYQASNLFTGIAPGYYSVYIKDSKTCVAVLDDILVAPDGCARFAANSRKPGSANVSVKAFPNPSSSEFTLTLKGFDSNQKVAVLVTDVLGRRVAQYQTNAFSTLKIGKQLQAGTYHVQLVQGTNRKSLTIVKD